MSLNKVAPLQKQKSLTVDCAGLSSPTIQVSTGSDSKGGNSPMGVPNININVKAPIMDDVEMIESSSSDDDPQEEQKLDAELLNF